MERWNDDRIDDFYEEFRRMVIKAEKIDVMEESLRRLSEDTKSVRTNLHQLRNDIATQASQLHKDLEDAGNRQAEERKLDRRWFIGTSITSAMLILGAISIILQRL